MGYCRFSLMLAVVFYHVAWHTLAGYMAVHGFFAISGYVITKACREIYGPRWQGKKYFLINRAVRLYPIYLSCLLISCFCIWATAFTSAWLHRYYAMPDTFTGWLVQFTILGQSNFTPERTPARILPAAWSLSTEVLYYLIIGLITGTSKRLTTLCFGASVAMAGYMYFAGYTFRYFYLTLHGPAYVFFTGAMAYYYSDRFAFLKGRPLWLCLLLVNLLLYVPNYIEWPGNNVYLPLYFGGTFLLFWLIPMFEHARYPSAKARWLNQWLADLTYPVFLIHWGMAVMVRYYVYYYYSDYEIPVFIMSLITSLAVGWLLVTYVEIPVKKLRRRIREKAQATA